MDTFTDSDLAKYRADSSTGVVINEEHRRVAQVIHDYDSSLEVQWIPPDQRTEDSTDHFRVVQWAEDGRAYEVFRFCEAEMDHRVLVKIWQSDTKRHNVLSEMEENNAAIELLKAKEWEDARAEMKEFAEFVWNSNKTVLHDGVRYE